MIGITEALVAIDVNSGRSTKEGSIEDTALKTNLEAAEEVARQLRLRDLAGLIVIDFIDMDERKNNAAVEKRMKDKLKSDRARIQVGRISGFGLMEMSRQRLRPGMIEATTQPCPACHGTGLIRSDDNLALSILRQIEEEGTRRRTREVLIKCPVGIANFIMNQKREHVAQIEARYGLSVRIEGDPMLVSPDFSMEKFKTASRNVVVREEPVVSVDSTLMEEIDEDTQGEEEAEVVTTEVQEDEKPKKRRRRRRRRSRNSEGEGSENGQEGQSEEGAEASEEAGEATEAAEPAPEGEEGAEPAPKKRRRRRRSRSKDKVEAVADDTAEVDAPEAVPEEPAEASAEPVVEDTPEAVETAPVEETAEPEPTPEEVAEAIEEAPTEEVVEVTEEVAAAEEVVAEAEPEPAPEPAAEEPTPEPVAELVTAEAEPAPEPVPAEPPKPKRRGWWNVGR